MHITNAFLDKIPNTYEGGDYSNDLEASTLRSGGYTEMVVPNQNQIYLSYRFKLLILVEFN
jgi:hypothetical protein